MIQLDPLYFLTHLDPLGARAQLTPALGGSASDYSSFRISLNVLVYR